MKASIALTLAILGLGSALGWREHQRISAIRGELDRLRVRASQAGISWDDAGAPRRPARRERPDEEAEARRITADVIAFVKEMSSDLLKEDAATRDRLLDLLDRLAGMNPAQMEILIAGIDGSGELGETGGHIVGFCLEGFSENHPQAALELAVRALDKPGKQEERTQFVSETLGRWAAVDPLAAARWMKETGASHPDLVTEATKEALLGGVARNDPKLAFGMIGELGVKEPSTVIRSIAGAADTTEARSAALAGLREFRKGAEGNEAARVAVSDSIALLVGKATQSGFEEGSRWLEKAGLDEGELAVAARNISFPDGRETAQWIGWTQENLPAGQAGESIRGMVKRWTKNDYKAAGEWLAAQPAGDARNVSVTTYAETIARYEPAAAAEWAMTLPAGAAREDTMRKIYNNWPKRDPAGRVAFGREHGFD